jgi:outer membrane protein TolC
MTRDMGKLHIPMAPRPKAGLRGLNSAAEPAGVARGSRHPLPGYTPWIFPTKAMVILAVLVVAWMALFLSRPVQGADLGAADPPVAPAGPLTFDDSVKLAIHHSPYFAKSSLEIDVRRMDESDSRYGMIPPLTFRTYYYVNHPSGEGINPKPYSLSFVTEPYNPLGSYFTLQAQKLATQMAILMHLKIISKGLDRLGQFYLELDALQKLTGYQQELIKLAKENLTYAENRFRLGTATSLEVKVARQEWQLAQGEAERMAMSRKRVLTNLKNFLGLKSPQEITPDSRDARHQVLGSFDPATATLEQTKNRSYELKALELKKQLQSYNVSLAIAKVFPTILFNTQTPDPLSVTSARGLYVGIGLDVPVWDGFKRIRNVSRQKAILREVGAEKESRENDLEDQWLTAKGDLQNAIMALKLAQSQEELARLQAHQHEISYESGEEPLPVFLESRQGILEAQKNTALKTLDYNKTVLALRQISGDLGNSYVHASSWQK